METTITTQPLTQLQRTAARLVGFLYLFTNATAIVAFIARGKLIVPRDAAQTSTNIVASEGLFRFGIATEIVTVAAVIVLVWGLYVILKPINPSVTWLATFLRLAENFFLAFVVIQEITALAVLKGAATMQGFDPQQLQGLSYTFSSRLHHRVQHRIRFPWPRLGRLQLCLVEVRLHSAAYRRLGHLCLVAHGGSQPSHHHVPQSFGPGAHSHDADGSL